MCITIVFVDLVSWLRWIKWVDVVVQRKDRESCAAVGFLGARLA